MMRGTDGDNPMIIAPEPLRAERFAPFGDVLEAPDVPGRLFYGDGLANRRAGAAPSLALVHAPPLTALPLVATRMERHEFSSQTFLALDAARWLVMSRRRRPMAGPTPRRHARSCRDPARASRITPTPGTTR
jgi:ureidoglycolate lyase